MSAPVKLIEIDPDTIFEYYNVSDIIEIHKKLQDEIENKKEDLRTMVGERYRDLILAADTIGEMKQTSSKVGNHIQNIIDSCVSLNDQQLLGFTVPIDSNYNNPKLNIDTNQYYSIVIQIKLLTILPELIWSAIDDEDYFIATQLFIFSRHISTGLQLKQNDDILKTLPVAKTQWDILSSFFVTIKKSCHKTLEREHLTPEIATKCLASLMLLENCQVEKLLGILIQFRSKSFLNCISDDKNHPKLKDKILSSLNILNDTILLLSYCFIDAELHKLLLTLTSERSPSTLCLLESEFDSELFGYLPDIITKFRPIFNFGELNTDTLQSSMESWMRNVENISKNQLKLVIDLITTVKTVHDIKYRALNLDKATNWSTICSSLYLPLNLDFYKFIYQPLILDRVKTIVKNSWKNLLNQTKQDIETLLKQKNSKTFKKYIWDEDQEDVPKSLKDALNASNQSHNLLMKTKGYIPSIVSLCNKMDERLESLYKDFSLFLSSNEKNDLKIDQSLQKEELEIIDYFKDCSREGVSDLITDIKSIENNEAKTNYILIARILHAISELCPNLKQCLSFNLFIKQTNLSQFDYWDRVCSLLSEESLKFWKLWIDNFRIDKNYLHNEINLNMLLKEFPNWENQVIEEKDEQENVIKSTIRIPSQPSYFLQKYLHSICCELNNIVPHTLPKFVINLLTDKLVNDLLIHYSSLTENEFVKGNQNVSLQYFFDIKFLNLIFVSRENKQLIEKCTNLTNLFKSYIDPFDFELFFNYINQNVKRSTIRMQQQLGCLISNNEQLSTILGGISQQNTLANTKQQDRDPNILALSSTANSTAWFPLLPIVSNSDGGDIGAVSNMGGNQKTSSTSKVKKSTDNLKQSVSSSALSTATNNVKSSAASFFGAMSQEWFRSS